MSIPMMRKTINLPNYYKLFGVNIIAKLFGVSDEQYSVVRWELANGEDAPRV